MFMFFLGFLAGWWACSWYIENGRSFAAFVPPAEERAGNGRAGSRETATAARRTRRA